MHHHHAHEEHNLIDLELDCLRCHGGLYAPLSVARRVIAEVTCGKSVILLCPYCGWSNMIATIKRQTTTND